LGGGTRALPRLFQITEGSPEHFHVPHTLCRHKE
jgi:hypothetical protein